MRREVKWKNAVKQVEDLTPEMERLRAELEDMRLEITSLKAQLSTEQKAYQGLLQRYQKLSGATKRGNNTERPDPVTEPAL